jgi:hypothetical protein
MKNIKVQFTKKSSNRKVGPIPTTTSESKTCPDACSLKNKGCYAKYSYTGIHWRNVDNGKNTKDWDQFCDEIKNLPNNQLWRHNVAGDLPGDNNKINHPMLNKLIKANVGKGGFTYTHKPVNNTKIGKMNQKIIKKANELGFTINLSADDLIQADAKYDLKIAPVAVVVPSDSPRLMKTPKGRHVITCPAVYKDNITCANCGLCQVSSRKAIIAFPAHGSGKGEINKRKLKVIN